MRDQARAGSRVRPCLWSGLELGLQKQEGVA